MGYFRMTSARAELEGMEAQAANLSCQESALMARAAGAEGLEHGEQARAAAAAAEAAGLKVCSALSTVMNAAGFGIGHLTLRLLVCLEKMCEI